ncbi:MAG: gamma-glutamyl-gamma-aminobutyrate hydrolase family protein [Phycisphaerae bacterium]|nr:gamma-glutamyl-gamma-aminobutyrate hydrolase family protein [Phycisphaerae bacterium]
MPSRPLIGISMDTGDPQVRPETYELADTYTQRIVEAGGIPLLLPHVAEDAIRQQLMEVLDGLLIPGGDDLNPALYGQQPHAKTRLMDQRRQAFDLAMLALAERHNLPTLGICLGFQLMNVQRHGSLVQYLPDVAGPMRVNHAADPDKLLRYEARHAVQIATGTRLAGIFGPEPLLVNSTHRQGVDQLGHGLVASACAADGLVEAIEDSTLGFWMGVQWHPERMPRDPQIKLFQALVGAGVQRRKP